MEQEEIVRDAIRAIVKEIEQGSRDIITILQGVHKPKGLSQVPSLCQEARGKFSAVKELYAKLCDIVPKDEFFRYHEHWRFVTQRLVFSAALVVFLETGQLIERDAAGEFLGISANPEHEFHVELDDFLLGLLTLADELTRLSLNSATFGDYKRPVQIAEFVSDMNAGFRLLNLKNDLLRKRFDGLKYSLKKVEEVVYDLSIRGLIPAVSS